MIDSKKLLSDLESKKTSHTTMVKRLEDDLRTRCDGEPEVDAPLKAQYETAKAKKRTALTYKAWRDEELTQVAVAWVLACVFVRFLEDNGLVETPKLSGPGERLRRAQDEHELFIQRQPLGTEREFLLEVFEETGRLPGMKEFFDKKHNPLWLAAPSGDVCRDLWLFWQKTNPETGDLLHDFTDPDWNTRFLGDLYQDLSEAARKKYALLQTPDFVEEFILDRTLTPAIETFGYREVRMIDPTCGSGHFVLGGFQRIFTIWQRENPGENPRVLAQRALDAVCGVDLNPFAVAIARFRLLLAALQVCGVKRLADAPDFHISLAVGDSLLHGVEPGMHMDHGALQMRIESTNGTYQAEDAHLLAEILSQQFHAVVGNPPYINVKDKALNAAYKKDFQSCHGQYSLSCPFMERFFDLALSSTSQTSAHAGFVGQITANSFMKREFGKKLIELCIPRWDLTHIIDSDKAQLPGHGTPTVILFGRNRASASDKVRVAMGIKKEIPAPADPGTGKVWVTILQQLDSPGFESEWLTVADAERTKFSRHPWTVSGGGSADLFDTVSNSAKLQISKLLEGVSSMCLTRLDDAYQIPKESLRRFRIPHCQIIGNIRGEEIRDHEIVDPTNAIFPYNADLQPVPFNESRDLRRYLWRLREYLWRRKELNGDHRETDRTWWEWNRFLSHIFERSLVIPFAFVSTHNNFKLSRKGNTYNRSAPVLIPREKLSYSNCLELVGVLTSSTGCFWMKQVFQDKGAGGIGGGISAEPWERRYEHDATKIQRFPIPAELPLVLPRELDRLAAQLTSFSPSTLTEREAVCASALAEAKQEAAILRARMISLQEELDWQCYRHYSLTEAGDELEWPENRLNELPPLTLGERTFEIRMARQMATGEMKTTWFDRHKDAGSKPITELPPQWPAEYRALVERRLAFIESNKNINLIERPEYKRRWNTEPWPKRQKEALRKWLLARLEGYFFEGSRVCDLGDSFSPATHGFTAATRPHLLSANQLADVVAYDTKFIEAAEVYEGASGFSVPKLVRELVEFESVTYLPVHLYTDSGLRKRHDWEETWNLQRNEDEVEEAVRNQNPGLGQEELKKKIRKAQETTVSDIPVPPKYAGSDFRKPSYWKLRGKLDVPKERWISYPGAERAGDDSLVIGWAGWDHLQQAQALAEYYLDAKDNQGWPTERLKPLLAGLADLIPWLKQWHNTPDPNLGMGLGDYFAGFLEEHCRGFGWTVEQADAIRFGERYEAPVPARPIVSTSVVKTGPSVSWRDSAFALLAPSRSVVNLYRIRLWPQLLIQGGNRIEFETFQKAYWLLTDPTILKQHGQNALPEIPFEWWDSRREATEVGQFEPTIRGAITGNEIRLIENAGTRYIEALNLPTNEPTPEVIDDARVALQTAESFVWNEMEIPAEIRNHSLEFEVV